MRRIRPLGAAALLTLVLAGCRLSSVVLGPEVTARPAPAGSPSSPEPTTVPASAMPMPTVSATAAFQPVHVYTQRATPLRSGATDPAVTFAVLAAGMPLEVLAAPAGARLLVRNPANGGIAYVAAGDVDPARPPTLPPLPPARSPAAPAAPVASPAPASMQRPLTAATARPILTSRPGAKQGGEPTYVVQPGETLYHIAASHGMTVEELAVLNGLRDPSHVRAGTVLRLPHVAG